MPDANRSLNGRFIQEMAEGSLSSEVFRRYLAQDNLYLFKYARAHAVLGAKSGRNDEFLWLTNKSMVYLSEHGVKANNSITAKDFERDALPITVQYANLFMQAAWHEHIAVGLAAVLPCQKLYDWLFATLKATRPISADNPYRNFIEQYADPSNHHTTIELETLLDRHAAEGLPEGVAELARMRYMEAMAFEAQFFEQAFTGAQLLQQRPASARWLLG